MSEDYINRDKLSEMLGLKQYARMVEWCKKEHISFRLAPDGFPLVTWTAFNDRGGRNVSIPDFSQVA